MTNRPHTEAAEHFLYTGQRQLLWIARTISYLVYFYLLAVEVILAIGFFLLLFGASRSASFVTWIYRSLDRTMKPFRGMFSPIELGATGNEVESILDTSILFAMVVYGIIAIAASAVVSWLSKRMARLEHEEWERQRRIEFDLRSHAGPAAATQPLPETPTPARSEETEQLHRQP